MRTTLTILALLVLGGCLAGCDSEAQPPASQAKPSKDEPSKAGAANERVAGVTYDEEHGEPAGLHRYRKWSDSVGQGAQPVGDVAFKNLKALGYKTVLSVDGAAPDVEGAKKHGLTYVHVPIGYDGIPEPLALQIAATLRIAGGPVFVHCHHGKHRGPAAAMVLRICEDKISNDEAVREMEVSKTSRNYTGLYRDIAAFKPFDAKKLATVKVLPSKVVPEGLRAGMVGVSQRWEFLKLAKANAWQPMKEHPDVSPPHEARMLWELYREMGRTDTECREKGEIFLAYLKEGEDAAIALEKAIRTKDTKAADKHYLTVKNNCAACHRDYRN